MDVAIIYLAKSADLSNPAIATISVPRDDVDKFDGDTCTITGWGLLSGMTRREMKQHYHCLGIISF